MFVGNAERFKVPPKSKLKEWYKTILMFAGDNLSMYYSEGTRARISEGLINLDLYNGIIHASDIKDMINPNSLSTIDATREIKHYAIASKIIDLLVGEEINFPFEPMVQITNNIGIDEKMERMRKYVAGQIDKMTSEAPVDKDGKIDEAYIAGETKKLQRKLKYTYKDLIEKKASALLAYYSEEQNFKSIFVEGYRRVFNLAEEAYEIDIIHGEPTIRNINTLNMRLYGGGTTSRMEDHDMIVVEDHISAGNLIARYGEDLTEDEVERILNFETSHSSGSFDKPYGDVSHEYRFMGDVLGTELTSNLIDPNGGIRHLRVRWKSYKKVKKVKFQDPVTGEDQFKTRSSNYTLAEGEVLVKMIRVPEWYIGSLIGYDIVVDAHPVPIRFNKLGNPLQSHPGIVGEIYNLNERRAVPMMSRMKPYQYWYDLVIDNMVIAMSKNIGPILEMDLAKRPTNWDTKRWLKYITKYNVKFVDSFKEVSKGPATGQLAGNLATGKDQVQELSFGNYIQQLVNMAQYLESAMANLVGISPQRMGAISNRETVGGVERATSQSSHITEWYSFKHQNTKIRALNVFIEAAKTALKDNPKRLQTIVDSTTRELLSVAGEDFVNSDLGIFVTLNKNAQKSTQVLEQAAQAYMQNGGDFSLIFKVLFSNSMADKRRLIEISEEERKEEAQDARQQEMQAVKMQEETAQKKDAGAMQMEKYKADLDAAVKLKLKEADVLIAQGKLESAKDLSLDSLEGKILQAHQTMKSDDEKNKVEREKISAQKEIANSKPDAKK